MGIKCQHCSWKKCSPNSTVLIHNIVMYASKKGEAEIFGTEMYNLVPHIVGKL